MIQNIKKKLNLENLILVFIIICPILDIISFLYRNYFGVSLSPTTLLRPIIPCIAFIILFFKEKNKKQKIGIAFIYAIYSAIHLIIFQKLHNGSSYGNLVNEAQYIVNYSFCVINLYLFYKTLKDKEKVQKAVFISMWIYIISLFFSIITKTSSSTYLEGIGYKGYFESGNSLCTVLLLGTCILLSRIKTKVDIKKVVLIVLTGIYLNFFSGMRTGLFGFCIILGTFSTAKFIINIRDKKTISKKQIVIFGLALVIIAAGLTMFGSKLLIRRKLLKEQELKNIDQETLEQRHVTGDILNLYKQIKEGRLLIEYMSKEEQQAIIDLCEYANKNKISNVNLRLQQFIYNVFLVKEQKSILLILFGNGYKNQTGELVMEMETPSLLCNFGLIGFGLFLAPIVAIYLYGLKRAIKNRKNIQIDTIMYITGCTLALGLSTLSGYVYFNFSSMTMALILNVFFIRDSFSIGDSSFGKIFFKKNCPK